MQAGYSHPVLVAAAGRHRVRVPHDLAIVVRGNDKAQVGEVAANIRKIRKPEPYKGKGIRYENEIVRKKAGKAAKGAGRDGGEDEGDARLRRHARVRKKTRASRNGLGWPCSVRTGTSTSS